MPFSPRCAHHMVAGVVRDQQYMFGVKSLIMVTKVLLMRKNLVAVLLQQQKQQLQQLILSRGPTGV